MLSDNLPPRQVPVETAVRPAAQATYVDWAAILAGGVFALALSFLLISFGASLGLSLTSPYRGEGMSAMWVVIAAGIWFAWVMVTGFGAGGYIAGRMRSRAGDATPAEVEVRDGMHGLMVWATGALVSLVLAATGASGLLVAGSSAVGKVSEVAGEAVSSDYFANLMLRGAVVAPEGGAATSDTAPATDGSAVQARPATQRGASVPSIDPAVQAQVAGILARSAVDGELADRDRDYLSQVVAANTDLDETEARARVDAVDAEIAEARAEALAAVERARVATVIFGFIAAATLLIGAVAAFFAAAAGGRHRDEGLGFDVFTARR